MHKNTVTNKNWSRTYKHKRPWFCKLYQQGQCTHVKDNKTGGKNTQACVFVLPFSGSYYPPSQEGTVIFSKKADKKRPASRSSVLESLSSKETRLVSQCKDNSSSI